MEQTRWMMCVLSQQITKGRIHKHHKDGKNYNAKCSNLELWCANSIPNTTPMALDESHHRLFVGTRDPSKLMVFDTGSGKMVSSLDIARDPDDIFYDALNKRIYVSCGEGFIDMFQQKNANNYNPIGSIPTAKGARTSLFVPELNRFYLAAPQEGNQASEIRVYKVANLDQ